MTRCAAFKMAALPHPDATTSGTRSDRHAAPQRRRPTSGGRSRGGRRLLGFIAAAAAAAVAVGPLPGFVVGASRGAAAAARWRVQASALGRPMGLGSRHAAAAAAAGPPGASGEWATELGRQGQELHRTLDKQRFEGAAADGGVVVVVNGRQRPVDVRLAANLTVSEDLAKLIKEAYDKAAAASLGELTTRLQETFAQHFAAEEERQELGQEAPREHLAATAAAGGAAPF